MDHPVHPARLDLAGDVLDAVENVVGVGVGAVLLDQVGDAVGHGELTLGLVEDDPGGEPLQESVQPGNDGRDSQVGES